jgi:hypothetical protein
LRRNKNVNKIILLFFTYFTLASQLGAQQKVVNIADFIKDKDATLAIHEAIAYCKQTKAQKLVFPKGKYDFYPDYAYEKYTSIDGEPAYFFGPDKARKFIFDISEMSDFEIDGSGSEFLLHGFISPFTIEKSTNINLKNFTIDYERTFHSEAKIIASSKDSVEVSFSDAYPYKVEKNILIFWDKTYTVKYPWWILLEFDTKSKEYTGHCNHTQPQDLHITELTKGTVRIEKVTGTPGNTMVFNPSQRFNHAISIYKCTNINLSNINIYHCGGVGIFAELTKNISIENVNTTATPGSSRMISTTADITYFCSCFGKIDMQNSLFENAQDDYANIHGTYAIINQILSPTEVIVTYVRGVEYVFPGNKVEIVEAPSYLTYAENKVIKNLRLNDRYSKLTLQKPLPKSVRIGDKIASIDEYPEVLIKNCKFNNGRSRMLLGSRAKTVIEKNYFHAADQAIVFDGWGDEQFGIRDLVIRDNVFDNCGFLDESWSAAIAVGTPIEKDRRAENKFHKNILIENNTFKVKNAPILNLYCVDGLIFRNNKIIRMTEYKQTDDNRELFRIEHSANVNIENEIQGKL